jgi:hypothetical protein
MLDRHDILSRVVPPNRHLIISRILLSLRADASLLKSPAFTTTNTAQPLLFNRHSLWIIKERWSSSP